MTTPMEVVQIHKWMKNAACKGNKEANWFPDKKGNNTRASLAVQICNTCPVKKQCLDYAITRPEVLGIWGGKSPKARRLLRAQRIKKCL